MVAKTGRQHVDVAEKLQLAGFKAFEQEVTSGREGFASDEPTLNAMLLLQRLHHVLPVPDAGSKDQDRFAISDDLPFELGEREQDIERQTAHGMCRIELLCHGDKGYVVLLECLHDTGEERTGAGD